MNSCLMLSGTLWTGIDLTAAFKDEDLLSPGIERDSHLTVLYAENMSLPFTDMEDDIHNLLGKEDWEDLIGKFKNQTPEKVLDHFGLSTFEGEDKDFLVLRLQPESPLYDTLQILHSGLKAKYEVPQKFQDYCPHMTLATMAPGKSKNYIFNPVLGLILEKATFTLDDFILSYGETDEPEDRKRYQVTTINAVSRFFRQLRASQDKDYYDSI